MGLTRGLAFAITLCIGEMTDLLVSGIAGISSTVDFYLSLLANCLWSSKFFPLSSPTLDLSKRTNQEIKCSMQSSKRLIGTFIRYNRFLITANTRKKILKRYWCSQAPQTCKQMDHTMRPNTKNYTDHNVSF